MITDNAVYMPVRSIYTSVQVFIMQTLIEMTACMNVPRAI